MIADFDPHTIAPARLRRQAKALFEDVFRANTTISLVSVPGRVNLIGEHIDYHDLPVLPMAIQRQIVIAFEPRSDRILRAVSSAQDGQSEFELSSIAPSTPGCWTNYLKAGAIAAQSRWKLRNGIQASVVSDLPVAAGLSSSTALLSAFTLALLQANGISPSLQELMKILPEGEQYVGTRGGGMDHAAVMASQPGCALLVSFAPLNLSAIPIPPDWRFLIAHSLTVAEKSGAVREQYNLRRSAGVSALKSLGFSSFRQALEAGLDDAPLSNPMEANAFRHTMSEAGRVSAAVSAIRARDFPALGQLLNESHASLRDRLQVSTPQIDELVEAARESGAAGARLTGAGFGGCIIALCKDHEVEAVRRGLISRYYRGRFRKSDLVDHLFVAEPSAGALANQVL